MKDLGNIRPDYSFLNEDQKAALNKLLNLRKDLDSKAWRIELGYSRDYAGLYGGATKSTAMSIRCIKDAE